MYNNINANDYPCVASRAVHLGIIMLVKSYHAGLVVTADVSREASMMLWCCCSATIETPYNVVTKRRLDKAEGLVQHTPVLRPSYFVTT